jgi:hypothetical protein
MLKKLFETNSFSFELTHCPSFCLEGHFFMKKTKPENITIEYDAQTLIFMTHISIETRKLSTKKPPESGFFVEHFISSPLCHARNFQI